MNRIRIVETQFSNGHCTLPTHHRPICCGCPSMAASWYLQCQYIVSSTGFMMTGEGWEAGSCRLAYTPSNDYLTPAGGCLPLRGTQTVTA